jgi:hypothetical protein
MSPGTLPRWTRVGGLAFRVAVNKMLTEENGYDVISTVPDLAKPGKAPPTARKNRCSAAVNR